MVAKLLALGSDPQRLALETIRARANEVIDNADSLRADDTVDLTSDSMGDSSGLDEVVHRAVHDALPIELADDSCKSLVKFVRNKDTMKKVCKGRMGTVYLNIKTKI